MKSAFAKALLAGGLISLTFAPQVWAQAANPEIVQTAPKKSLEAIVAEQAAQIEQQNAAIAALQDQINQMGAILAARVDRVEAATDSGKVIASNPGPRIESPNAKNTFALIGAVQATVGLVDQSSDGAATPRLRGGTDIRRARIGVQGTAFNDFAYQAEIDLAQTTGSASAAARDVWVQYNGFRPVSLTVGNQKPQTGMEASFSDRSNAGTFIEPSMMSSMITATGARNIGLRVSSGGAHWSGSIGYYGDDVNNNGVSAPAAEGNGAHWRLTYAPIADKTKVLHFGTSGYYRNVANGAGAAGDPIVSQLRVRAQAEYAVDPTRVIDTGNLGFADTVLLYAGEAAAIYGPFGLQAEYARMEIEQKEGRPDLSFNGGYVSANYFLTGESRVYDPRTGVFTRMAPKANVDPASGTWGAWEMAARYSTLDLNSDPNRLSGTGALRGIRGGEADNYTLGLNWYWNPYFRMMVNYTHAKVDNQTNAVPGSGAEEGGKFNIFSLRVQQEW